MTSCALYLAVTPGARGVISESVVREIKAGMGMMLSNAEEVSAPAEIRIGDRTGTVRWEVRQFGTSTTIHLYTILEDGVRATFLVSCRSNRFDRIDPVIRAIASTARLGPPRLVRSLVGRWLLEAGEAVGEGDARTVSHIRSDGRSALVEARKNEETGEWERVAGTQEQTGRWSASARRIFVSSPADRGMWTSGGRYEVRGDLGGRTLKVTGPTGQEIVFRESD